MIKNLARRFTFFAVRLFTSITCRIDAPDLRKIPIQGPIILVVNHTGQIEVPLLFSHLQPRKATGWAKIEIWNNWFLNIIFNLWGAVPIRRGEADMSALKNALRLLENGYIFGIAPEGTRNKTGILKRAYPGTVIIALHSNAPLIPVAHWGGEVFLRNLKRLTRTDFHIRVGEPFRINTRGAKVSAGMRQQIVDEMMYRIAALLPEEYRGEYADLQKASSDFLEPVTLSTEISMNETNRANDPKITYQQLERFALWYLLCEFAYAALWIAIMILIVLANLISPDAFYLGSSFEGIIILGIALPYGLAFLGNLVMGIWGLFIYVNENREGYPGTGHLLNWIFIISLFWVALFFMAVIATSY